MYYAGSHNADGAASFQSTDFGTFDADNDNFILNGGELKTWYSCSNDWWSEFCANVCGGQLNFRIYASGSPGDFTSISLPWSGNISGNNQQWSTTNAGIDLLDGLSEGQYTLEVWWHTQGSSDSSTGCSHNRYDRVAANQGFTASFAVAAPALSGVCVLPSLHSAD
jgi:hypothetical protein|tara:strand:+ start:231 stop:728 length:498 start_codon:yes stop_codon:yes gene_type:complete